MMWEKVVFLQFHVLYLFTTVCYPYTMQVHTWDDIQDKQYRSKYAMLSTRNNEDSIMKLVRLFLAQLISLCHSDVN